MDIHGRLVSLSVQHESALEVFLSEFDANPDELHGYFCPRDSSIEQAVRLLHAWSEGEELAEGWVPCSTWFWESEGVLQGVINVRHELTPSLRELGGHRASFPRAGLCIHGLLKVSKHIKHGV